MAPPLALVSALVSALVPALVPAPVSALVPALLLALAVSADRPLARARRVSHRVPALARPLPCPASPRPRRPALLRRLWRRRGHAGCRAPAALADNPIEELTW